MINIKEYENKNEMTFQLDSDQQLALNDMTHGANVFLTGGGGTGKSKVLEIFKDYYRKRYPEDWKKYLAVTSTTGSSALLVGGTTIHSFSGIGIGKDDDDKILNNLSKRRFIVKNWKQLRVLIIDEISMLTPRMFSLIYKLAQIIRKDMRPFGGIQVILSGDFCQLSPILEKNAPPGKEYCFETVEWTRSKINIHHLEKIHRQNDVEFIEALQKIRMGQPDEDITHLLMTRFNAELENPYGVLPVQLFPTREKANSVNLKHLNKLIEDDAEIKKFTIATNIVNKDGSNIVPNKIDLEKKVKSYVPIDNELSLCIGCQVILVVNLSIEDGLVNGSKGCVQGFAEDESPIVVFANGKTLKISPYTWDIDDGPVTISVQGIPLILGYGCTIHRSQGMSIDLAVIDIGADIFSGNGGYGQVYVALSRVRSLEGLCILHFDPRKIKCNPKVLEFYKNLPKARDLKSEDSLEDISTESGSSEDSTKSKRVRFASSDKFQKGDIRNFFGPK